jgi:hypothetical protein
MKFEEVQARINKLFGGQAALVADTYSGKIDKLNVAAAQATETIGKGLVEAISKLGGTGSDNIDNVTKSMNDLAKVASAIVNTFADVFQAVVHPIDYLNQDLRGPAYKGTTPAIQAELAKKAFEDRMKAIRDEMAAAAKLTAEKKKQLALDKAKASLAKAQANFDITKINLAAALKGKVSEDEKNRLLALQAIENNNGEEALKYIAKIDAARAAASAAELARQKLAYDDALAKIKALNDAIASRQQYLLTIGMNTVSSSAASESASGYSQSFLNDPYVLGGSPESLGLSDRANTERNAAMNIVLNIDGTQVSNALYNNSNSGTASSSSRSTGTFSA